jgi:hypothetical protein
MQVFVEGTSAEHRLLVQNILLLIQLMGKALSADSGAASSPAHMLVRGVLDLPFYADCYELCWVALLTCLTVCLRRLWCCCVHLMLLVLLRAPDAVTACWRQTRPDQTRVGGKWLPASQLQLNAPLEYERQGSVPLLVDVYCTSIWLLL